MSQQGYPPKKKIKLLPGIEETCSFNDEDVTEPISNMEERSSILCKQISNASTRSSFTSDGSRSFVTFRSDSKNPNKRNLEDDPNFRSISAAQCPNSPFTYSQSCVRYSSVSKSDSLKYDFASGIFPCHSRQQSRQQSTRTSFLLVPGPRRHSVPNIRADLPLSSRNIQDPPVVIRRQSMFCEGSERQSHVQFPIPRSRRRFSFTKKISGKLVTMRSCPLSGNLFSMSDISEEIIEEGDKMYPSVDQVSDPLEEDNGGGMSEIGNHIIRMSRIDDIVQENMNHNLNNSSISENSNNNSNSNNNHISLLEDHNESDDEFVEDVEFEDESDNFEEEEDEDDEEMNFPDDIQNAFHHHNIDATTSTEKAIVLNKLYNCMKIADMDKYGIDFFYRALNLYQGSLTEQDFFNLTTSYWCHERHFKALIKKRGTKIAGSRLELPITTELLNQTVTNTGVKPVDGGPSIAKIKHMLRQRRKDLNFEWKLIEKLEEEFFERNCRRRWWNYELPIRAFAENGWLNKKFAQLSINKICEYIARQYKNKHISSKSIANLQQKQWENLIELTASYGGVLKKQNCFSRAFNKIQDKKKMHNEIGGQFQFLPKGCILAYMRGKNTFRFVQMNSSAKDELLRESLNMHLISELWDTIVVFIR